MAANSAPYRPADDSQHDLGPWIEAPQSSRVSKYRYDYAARQLQVAWANGKGHGTTVYGAEPGGFDSEAYRRFARAVSKGKFVNRILNGYGYAPASPDEINAPSNPLRKVVQSRP